MPEGPLGVPRFTSLGPLVEGDNPYENGFYWALNHELADFIWNRVEESDSLIWGPDPPLLVELDMGHGFERESMNKMLFTRNPGDTSLDADTWYNIPSKFNMNYETNPSTLERVFDPEHDTSADSSKIMSQLYTTHGAMITFDLVQNKDEPASGMIRMPFPREMADRAKQALDEPNFEYFEYQYRNYTDQFGTPPEGRTEYYHPHFSSGPIRHHQAYIDWFGRAFNMVERGVQME